MKVQVQLSEVEEKLREYELALKKHELEKIRAEENEEKKANIEARVIKISKGSYRLKVWPFEYLEPGSNFEECVVIHGGSAPKFEIISTWEDEKENKYENIQLRSI